MTQQHLNHTQIRAVIQQMRRKGMAQGMRRQFFLDAGLFGITFDDVPKRLARHAIAAARGKQIVRLAFQQDLNARALHELLQPLHGLLAQRNQALAVAFADNAHHTLIQVHLIVLEAHEFGDPQTRGVQHFEHGSVAMPQRLRHRGRFQQRIHLGFGQRFRQRAADFRHRDLRRGILRNQSLAHHEAEEAAETRQLPGSRSGPGSTLDSGGNESQ